MSNVLDKVGSIGAVIAGMAVPCCFPFLSLFGSILGLSLLPKHQRWVMYAIQILVLVALAGAFIAYRGHRKVAPLILGIVSSAAVIFGLNNTTAETYIYYTYGGMLGLLAVAVWNSIEARRCEDVCKA